jgi:thiol-disulfide isomerase/thioredoxin
MPGQPSRGAPADVSAPPPPPLASPPTAAPPVTDESFEADVLKSSVPVLVDFWAPWCGPCRMIAPLIDEIAVEYKGKVKCVSGAAGPGPTRRAGWRPLRRPVRRQWHAGRSSAASPLREQSTPRSQLARGQPWAALGVHAVLPLSPAPTFPPPPATTGNPQFKLNTDDSPRVATEYGIRSIPTVMIFKDGQKMETIIGARRSLPASHSAQPVLSSKLSASCRTPAAPTCWWSSRTSSWQGDATQGAARHHASIGAAGASCQMLAARRSGGGPGAPRGGPLCPWP